MVDREVSRFLYDRDLSHGDRQTVTHSTAACSISNNQRLFRNNPWLFGNKAALLILIFLRIFLFKTFGYSVTKESSLCDSPFVTQASRPETNEVM